jgi:hypothetical protein
MANGTDNCHPLLANHKQILMPEPHCLLWNIMPSGILIHQQNSYALSASGALVSVKRMNWSTKVKILLYIRNLLNMKLHRRVLNLKGPECESATVPYLLCMSHF